MTERKLIPPDGGWGWVIMFAYGLNNLVMVPVMQSFGFLVKDTFAEMGLSAADTSIILTTNAAGSMMMGLINGPLLNRYSYRKVSVASALLFSIGMMAVVFATTFWGFLISYGFIASIGTGLAWSSYALALNTYFKKNRSKAVGYTFTITGLGSILMPQLMSFLLEVYSVHGATLIITGLGLNCFVAALLLHPVKWHIKEETTEEKPAHNLKTEHSEEFKQEESTAALLENGNVKKYRSTNLRKASIVDSTMSIDHDVETQSIYGFDAIPFTRQSSAQDTVYPMNRRRSASISEHRLEPINKKWTSSLRSINLEHSLKLYDEPNKMFVSINEDQEEPAEISNGQAKISTVYNSDLSVSVKKKSLLSRVLWNIVHFFDLSLLKDMKYVNIMLGMSLAMFAEANFSILTPFILNDIGLDNQNIATFLSVLSVLDLIVRFISPFIGDYFQASARIMFMISMVLLITTRFILVFVNDFKALLVVAAGLGVAKGVRTVYMSLVIPNYVPLERLASAAGLQMVTNGVLILAGGPFLGLLRDMTGSYVKCVFAMNFVTFCTLVMWATEIIYYRIKVKRKEGVVEKS